MSEFLNMGGYAAYVWPAWGVSLAVLAGLAVAVARKRKTALKAAKELLKV